jgi:hypothetical protein
MLRGHTRLCTFFRAARASFHQNRRTVDNLRAREMLRREAFCLSSGLQCLVVRPAMPSDRDQRRCSSCTQLHASSAATARRFG